jgi:ribose transport system substrate-binding protein
MLFVVLLLVGLQGAWAAGKTEAPSAPKAFNPKDYPLGLVIWNKYHPVVQIMEAGFLVRGEELGYPVKLYAAGPPDLAQAIALGEAGIAEGVKGMVVYLLDPGIYPLIKKCADNGIPVVTAHTVVDNPSDIPGLLAWVAADSKAYGRESAKHIAEQVGGKGTVAITQGSFNVVENDAAKAFTDYIKANYPNMKVLAPMEEGFDPAVAESRIVALLQANTDVVAGFGTTGGSPITWAAAKRATGRKNVVVIGMDYSRQNLDLVKSGEIYGIVAQPLYEEHALAVDLLDKILRGEKVSFANPMQAPIVTKANVEDFYKLLETVEKAFQVPR